MLTPDRMVEAKTETAINPTKHMIDRLQYLFMFLVRRLSTLLNKAKKSTKAVMMIQVLRGSVSQIPVTPPSLSTRTNTNDTPRTAIA